MRVGLIKSPAARLTAYWSAYLKELGAEVISTDLADAEVFSLGQQSLPSEAPTVQLALGRILALENADLVLIPQWPTVANDAWSTALPELLARRISNLPALLTVPDGKEGLEDAAAELGLRVSHNAGRVRLALEKVRPLATEPKQEMPMLSKASQTTVAVIGPKTLLAEPLFNANLRDNLDALGLHSVFGYQLPTAEVLRRAERMENLHKAPQGEQELFGATSLLAGKSAVRGLIFVSPARDGATRAALDRIAAKLHKPVLQLSIDTAQQTFPTLEAFRNQITLGTTTLGTQTLGTQTLGTQTLGTQTLGTQTLGTTAETSEENA